ncbi:hypothetical protein [Roseivirga sp.]|uniref:hypothetical protein n=1 Tax=Roseivirga sp. TaxID=1964215 RepID=UPI003B528E5E
MMRSIALSFLLCLIVGNSMLSQSISASESGISSDMSDLSRSNKRLLKDLDKLKRKGSKVLARQYPELNSTQIDSLITNYAQSLDDSLNTEGIEAKQKIQDWIVQTPEKLPVSDELKESIAHINEIEAIQQLNKDTLKVKDVFTAQNMRRLDKGTSKVLEDLEQYKANFEGWDEALLSSIENLPQAQLVKEKLDHVKDFKALPKGYRKDMSKLQTNNFVRDQLEEKAAELEAMGESLQERFDEALVKMNEAKMEFPSLESLEDAPRNYNPYQGQSLMQRTQVGGNISLNSNKPISLDVTASFVYPFNKRLSSGIEAGGRIYLEKREVNNLQEDVANDLVSFRAVSRYALSSTFYIQSNYEINRFRKQSTDQGLSDLTWYRTALIGLGRHIVLRDKVRLNITTFYDLFYKKQNSPNAGPWIIRLGFQL